MSGGTAPKKLREKWEEESNQKLFQKEIKSSSSGSQTKPLSEKRRFLFDEIDKLEYADYNHPEIRISFLQRIKNIVTFNERETLKNIKEELEEKIDTKLILLGLIGLDRKEIKEIQDKTFLKHAGEFK